MILKALSTILDKPKRVVVPLRSQLDAVIRWYSPWVPFLDKIEDMLGGHYHHAWEQRRRILEELGEIGLTLADLHKLNCEIMQACKDAGWSDHQLCNSFTVAHAYYSRNVLELFHNGDNKPKIRVDNINVYCGRNTHKRIADVISSFRREMGVGGYTPTIKLYVIDEHQNESGNADISYSLSTPLSFLRVIIEDIKHEESN